PSIGVGKLINSGEFDGMDSEEAKWKIAEKVGGKRTVQYKLRDWLISRQRYWGAPIPIIYCDDCARLRQGFGGQGEHPVPEEDLPVVLPTDVDFRPTGESPLQRSESFHKVKCPKCGKDARRESDTMDTFVDSSWYWLRYTDPKNEKEFASKDKIKAWLPVDTYVGGAEHAVLHLMYARFITMALRDLGYLDFEEPFLQLRNQGLILGPDGQKMSKSRGNVINPDEVVEKFGADTMRLYEMFMGPLEDSKPWDTNGMVGVRRFLDRVWEIQKLQMSKSKIQTNVKIQNPKNTVERDLHKLIKKVGSDIESFDFNTAVSQFMIFVNAVYKAGEISQEHLEMFLKVLSPFAPHLANEAWEKLGHKELMEKEIWPKYDESLLQDEMVTYIVQVNGKLRAQISAAPGASEERVAA
ncbi:MAG: class I tRNA ligase family protein, partial [Patescibacteria group bacterium]